MMRARTLGTIQRLSGHASDQAPYRVLKVAPPMGHRSATVVVYFAGTHLTWGMRVLGQWTWAVGSWAFYLWSLVLGFGSVLRHRIAYINNDAQMEAQSHTLDSGWHPLTNSDIIPFVQHQPKVLDLT